MAIRWTAGAWRNSQAGGNDLLVLLALTDAADDETGTCWPGVKHLARRARLDVRSVQRILRRLEDSGELETISGAGPHGTNLYRLSASLVDSNYATKAPGKLPPPDKLTPGTSVTTPPTPASPKPSVKPSDKEKEIRARGIKLQNPTTQPPARDPWDVPDDIEAARRRRDFWQAYCRGLGIDQGSPEYLAIESKSRPYLPDLAAGANGLEPEELEEATRYLVARWQAGGIFAHPTITHAFGAIGEYRRWQAAGRPSLERTAKRGRGADRPAVAELPLDDQAWNAVTAAGERRKMDIRAGNNPAILYTGAYLEEMRDEGQISDQVLKRALELCAEHTEPIGLECTCTPNGSDTPCPQHGMFNRLPPP